MNLLGVDGMSSDESDIGDNGKPKRYLVKPLTWRSNQLSSWLCQVDRLVVLLTAEKGKGRKPLSRVRYSSTASVRQVRGGLPASFYSDESQSKVDVADAIPLPRIDCS
jgi:hypothetical protein